MTAAHSPRLWRLQRPLALLGVVLAVFLGATPGIASAHAGLAESTPTDGAIVETAPDRVRLVFNEDVTVPANGIAVVDGEGTAVDDGQIEAAGPAATIGVDAGLPDGGYAVTFRVVSVDGHVIAGAITFAVGDRAAAVDVTTASASPWRGVGTAARFLATVGVMIAAGGSAVVVLCRVRLDRRLRAVLSAAGAVGILGLLLGLPAQAATVGGGRLVWDAGAVLGNGVGAAVALGIAGTGAALATLRRFPTAALVAAFVACASFAATGHTRTGSVIVEGVADVAHVAGGAIWLGGLVVLIAGRGIETADRRAVIARFSTLATAAVVVVGAAGLALSLSEVSAIEALTSTTYGRTLLLKTAIVALVGVAGVYNHFFLLPRVLTPAADQPSWTAFRRVLGVETAGVLVVLAVTAGLVNQSPGTVVVDSPTFQVATEVGTVQIEQDDNVLQLTFAQPPAGSALPDEVDLELRSDRLAAPAIQRTARRTDAASFVVDPLTLPAAGDWTITVRVRVDRFRAASFSTTVPLS